MSEGSHSPRRSPLHAGAELLVAATPGAVALCLGGASAWALGSLTLLSCGAFGLSAIAARRGRRGVHVPAFAFVFVAATVAVALQLVPLPPGVLKGLSPAAAELREFVLVPLGLPRAGPLTLDPPATWRELAKHLGYLALFLAAAHAARSRTGLRRIVGGVALGGIAIAVVGLGHKLLALDSVFGLYRFEHLPPPVVTPFGNANHLAAFVSLSAGCALAMALGERDRARSSLWAMGFLTAGAVVVLSLSRGGVLFFAIGQLLAALFVWQRRERARSKASSAPAPRGLSALVRRIAPLRRTGFVVGAALVAIGIGAFVGLEEVGGELERNDSFEKIDRSAKYGLWPMMWRAARQFRFTGMGRGAWESAFTRFQDHRPNVVFTHPENGALQLVAELGVPLTIALVVGGALLLWRALRRASLTETDLVLAASLVSALLHDVFDFSLELPATASAAIVLLGVLLRRRDEATGSLERWSLKATTAAVAALAGGVLAAGALWAGRSTLAEAEARLADATGQRLPPARIVATVRPLIREHPSDYLMHSWAASALAAPEGDPQLALAFANRALFLWPLDANAHRAAARALLREGRRMQAMTEYRLAWEAGDRPVLAEALPLAQTVEELRAMTPADARAVGSVAAMLWSADRRDHALALEDLARAELPAGPGASDLWALSARHKSAAGATDEAVALAREALRLDPLSPRASLALAQTLERAGRRAEAILLLEAALHRDATQVDCALTLARLLHRSGKREDARAALNRLSGLVSNAAARARIQAVTAELLLAEGRIARAIDAFGAAVRLEPANPGHRYALARAYEQARRPEEASKQVREGLRLEGRPRQDLLPWLARLDAQQKEIDARRKAERVLGTAGADVPAP